MPIESHVYEFGGAAESTMGDAKKTFDRLQQEFDELLAGLSLPLVDSLGVPPDQVAAKSQEILETLIRLRQEQHAVLHSDEAELEKILETIPEEQRNETRAAMKAVGGMF